MSSATVATLDGVLKVYYDDFKVKMLQYNESPTLAVISRMTKFGGKNLPIPILYGTPQGRSATFATAQSSAVGSSSTDFVLTRAKDYGVVTIDNEAMEASEAGDKAAFVSARVTEIDGIFTQVTRSLSTALFGTGSGSIGNVGSINAGVSITLSDVEQIVNFDKNMTITASSADASGARAGSMLITGVDRDAGVISGVTTNITALAANDFIQVSGDLALKLTGFSGWIPAAAPTSTAFFGVDRTADVTRLGGVRVTTVPSGISPEEKIMRTVARCMREGAKPDLFVVNVQQFANLQASLGARATISMLNTPDNLFGFDTIKITCGTSTVDVLADPYCPTNVGYCLEKGTWKLYTLGEAPRFDKSDGLMVLRQSAADGVECRVKYYGQLGCVAPGHNGRVAL